MRMNLSILTMLAIRILGLLAQDPSPLVRGELGRLEGPSREIWRLRMWRWKVVNLYLLRSIIFSRLAKLATLFGGRLKISLFKIDSLFRKGMVRRDWDLCQAPINHLTTRFRMKGGWVARQSSLPVWTRVFLLRIILRWEGRILLGEISPTLVGIREARGLRSILGGRTSNSSSSSSSSSRITQHKDNSSNLKTLNPIQGSLTTREIITSMENSTGVSSPSSILTKDFSGTETLKLRLHCYLLL